MPLYFFPAILLFATNTKTHNDAIEKNVTFETRYTELEKNYLHICKFELDDTYPILYSAVAIIYSLDEDFLDILTLLFNVMGRIMP